MGMKNYVDEFNKFKSKIEKNEPFSLVRFGDGELYILSERYIDIRKKCNGEWKYDPDNERDSIYRDILIESMKYKSHDYYVGILTGCICYADGRPGEKQFMMEMSEQSMDNLTFASIFANMNYRYRVPGLIREMSRYKTILIVHEKANVIGVPLNIESVYRVGINAWIDSYGIIDELREAIESKYSEKYLFLVCAGPLSNMIVHELHKLNKDNTYINFGSTLDGYMFDEFTRYYQKIMSMSEHNCIWR